MKEDLKPDELSQLSNNLDNEDPDDAWPIERFPFLKKLKFLGHGNTREVFLYNNKYVIKLATGDYGNHANNSEVEVYNKFKGQDFNILAKILNYDEKYYNFIIMERASVFKSEEQFNNFYYKGEWDNKINDLVEKGLNGGDLHWRNFGFKGKQLKLIDYAEE